MTTVNRRRSGTTSSLGGELRGDTSASAISTLHVVSPTFTSPPVSPVIPRGKTARRSKRRKVRSLFRRWKDLSFRHTWINPLVILSILLIAYAINPTPSNALHGAIFLSYRLSPSDPFIPGYARNVENAPVYYGKGPMDFAFVAFYIVVLSFTREFLMQRVIRPFAIWNGIRSRAKQNRFMEQAYTALYFAVFGPLGLYVMSRGPVWYFNTAAMYEGFPHRSHDTLFKAYYLLQASYWAQQAIVLCLQLEKPRKDFKELVAHHVVTVALIWLSYRFHFTHMGLAVYITHDVSDFFLATSKTLNYLSSPLTVPYFVVFVGVWIYLRHYINLVILYSILTTYRTIGPFELNWETQQYKSPLSQGITFALLSILQGINLFWLYFIVKIAFNVVLRETVKDVRSDDEDEEIEEVSKLAPAPSPKRLAKVLHDTELTNGKFESAHVNGQNCLAENAEEGKKSR